MENFKPGQKLYPDDLTFPEEKSAAPFDFQKDFSYLKPPQEFKNLDENAENSKKDAQNHTFFNNFEENFQNSFDFQKNSANFEENSTKNGDFSFQNDLFENFKQKNTQNSQKNGLNFENLISLLKNSNSGDLLATALTSGMLKNQNPILTQALGKILDKKPQKAEVAKKFPSSNDYFEEV